MSYHMCIVVKIFDPLFKHTERNNFINVLTSLDVDLDVIGGPYWRECVNPYDMDTIVSERSGLSYMIENDVR